MSEQSPDPTPPAVRPRRRRGLSLRVALGLVAVIALALGWMMHQVGRRREGIELVRSHGGMYHYDYEYTDDFQWPKSPEPRGPGWLIRLLGVDALHHATWVRIEDPTFDDDDLARLMDCQPGIRTLGLVGTGVTDEGLRHFRGNRRIAGLFLDGHPITDRGIDDLAPESTPELELISLRGTRVTDARAKAIQALFDAREAAARARSPGKRISTHIVLSGPGSGGRFYPEGSDPRGEYESTRGSGEAPAN